MEQLNTLEANKRLREILDEELQELLEAGRITKESDTPDGIKILDPDSGECILEDDEDKYNALNLLQELTDFDKTPANEIYEFPGMSLNDETMKLRIPKGKVEKLAELGKRLESDLSYIGLKFPTQLYQFTKENKGQNLPGKDFPAPLPKTVEMSNSEYETYLEEYYKTHGIEKEADEAAFRRQYPHEKIDYSEANEEKKGFANEYYTEQVAEHAKGKGETTKAPVGEKIRVVAKSLKRPNIFDCKDRVEGTQKWQKVESFVIKTAAIAAGLGVAGMLAWYNPGFLVLGAGAAAFALVRYIKKRRERKRRLARELEEEEEKKEAEEAVEEAKKKEKELEKDKDKGEDKDKEKDKGTPGDKKPEDKKTDGTPGDKKPEDKPGEKKTEPTKKSTGGTDGVPGGTDGKAGGTDGKPEDKTSDTPSFEALDFSLAEEELGMDQVEYMRINSEIRVLAQEVDILLKTGTPADKERLKELQDQLAAKLAERLNITYRLMNRQEKLLDDAGITFKR